MDVHGVMTTRRAGGLHGVTLDKFHFLLATQLTDDLSNFATEAIIKYLLTVLRDDHHMVFALPFNMG